jgi:glycosyltransferase 2 family protein
MRQLSRFIPHCAIAAFAIWCLFSLRSDLARMSIEPMIRSWDLVALALLLSLLNYGLRIFRWKFYLARLGYPLGLRFTAATYCAGFAYTLSPGKVGEMVRARYYLPVGVPLAGVAAAFLAERLMDLVAMTALAALVFTASARYEGGIIGAAALIAAALATLSLTPWSTLAAALHAATRIPGRFRSVLAGVATALASTRALLRPRVLLASFAVGLLAWGLEGAGLGLLGSIFPSTPLSVNSAIGIYGVAVLIGGLSFLPGGLGGTEAVMTALLVKSGFPMGEALLLTLTCRLVTLWFAVVLGWVAVLALRQRESSLVLP